MSSEDHRLADWLRDIIENATAAEDYTRGIDFAQFRKDRMRMDAVEAIHAAPRDPDKGEGWMKGEMLAEPVVILNARVVENEAG